MVQQLISSLHGRGRLGKERSEKLEVEFALSEERETLDEEWIARRCEREAMATVARVVAVSQEAKQVLAHRTQSGTNSFLGDGAGGAAWRSEEANG